MCSLLYFLPISQPIFYQGNSRIMNQKKAIRIERVTESLLAAGDARLGSKGKFEEAQEDGENGQKRNWLRSALTTLAFDLPEGVLRAVERLLKRDLGLLLFCFFFSPCACCMHVRAVLSILPAFMPFSMLLCSWSADRNRQLASYCASEKKGNRICRLS